MLGGPRHDQRAFGEAASGAEEGEVDRLCAGGGECDLGAVGAQGVGSRVTRAVESGS